MKTQPLQGRQKAAVLIIFGLFLVLGFGWTVWGRLLTNVDGVIVASRDVPSTGAPRYATEYTVRGPDGKDQTFWAGATDASLPRSMPVGTRIRKERWQLDYEKNGKRESFYYMFYGGILGTGIILMAWGVLVFATSASNGGAKTERLA